MICIFDGNCKYFKMTLRIKGHDAIKSPSNEDNFLLRFDHNFLHLFLSFCFKPCGLSKGNTFKNH